MGTRLVITNLKDVGRAGRVVRVLGVIPNLTAGVIQNQLKLLPWMLPDIPDFDTRQNIKENLEKIGCTIEERYLETRGKSAIDEVREGHSRRNNSNAEITPPQPPSIKLRQSNTIKPDLEKVSQLSASILPQVKRAYKKEQRKGRKYAFFWISVIFFLVISLFWYLKPKEHTGEADPAIQHRSQPSKAEKEQSPIQKQTRQQLRAQAQAEYDYQLVEKAILSENPKRQGKILKKAVKHNPFNTEAWKLLIQNYRNRGDAEAAAKTRQKAYEQNEKVRAVLASIARQFGTPGIPLQLNKNSFNFRIKIGDKTPTEIEDHSYKFYKEVHASDNRKEINAEFYGDYAGRYQFSVPKKRKAVSREKFRNYFKQIFD